MVRVDVLGRFALSMLLGASAARSDAESLLAPLCGDRLCRVPCTVSEGPDVDCIPPPTANDTGPAIVRDCYEHTLFGGECAACNVTGNCPNWCPEVRSAGCRPYEMICGYVETVEFQGAREDLVTMGPLFCRIADCVTIAAIAANGTGGDACWWAVDGHEVCCVDGVPTFADGSLGAVTGSRDSVASEAAAGVALVPAGAEPNGAEGRGRAGRTAALHAVAVGVAVGLLHAYAAGGIGL